ncbi:MAG: DUF4177 domain-containing protein [Rhodobacteraceae bacterium]|nr:DUF4177 domain-containing protein [Paracoccaceae bacterium]
MQAYEYTAIPAPTRADKNRALKTPGERFGATVGAVLNRMAADGWEYLRADVLPSEERSGLTSRTTVFHNLLIFRRALAQDMHAHVSVPEVPEPLDAPDAPPDAVPTFLTSARPALSSRLNVHAESGTAPRLGPATTQD